MSQTKRLFEKSESNTEKKRPIEKWKPTRKGATCVDCKEKLEWDSVVWDRNDRKPRCEFCAKEKNNGEFDGLKFCAGCKKLLDFEKDRFCSAWGLGDRTICVKCRGNRYSVGVESII